MQRRGPAPAASPGPGRPVPVSTQLQQPSPHQRKQRIRHHRRRAVHPIMPALPTQMSPMPRGRKRAEVQVRMPTARALHAAVSRSQTCQRRRRDVHLRDRHLRKHAARFNAHGQCRHGAATFHHNRLARKSKPHRSFQHQRIDRDRPCQAGTTAPPIPARQIRLHSPVTLVAHAPPARCAIAEFTGRRELAGQQPIRQITRQDAVGDGDGDGAAGGGPRPGNRRARLYRHCFTAAAPLPSWRR